MSFSRRYIGNSDLSVMFNRLKRFDVNVPMLKFSKCVPEYVETRDDGTEIYNHDGRTIEVKADEVIDSYGNVVNLIQLEAKIDIENIKRFYGNINEFRKTR